MQKFIELLISKKESDNIRKCLDLRKLDNAELIKICDPLKLISQDILTIVTIKSADSLDFTKLSNNQLHEMCDYTKMDPEKYMIAYTENINEILNVVLRSSSITFNDLMLIEFDEFSDEALRYYVGYTLSTTNSTDKICLFLDKIKSVNYGIYSHKGYGFESINPLLFCANNDKFDMLKLLIEKYGADINHLGYDMTAIMLSANRGNVDITKYLYDKGAKLSTSKKNIYEYASKSIRKTKSE